MILIFPSCKYTACHIIGSQKMLDDGQFFTYPGFCYYCASLWNSSPLVFISNLHLSLFFLILHLLAFSGATKFYNISKINSSISFFLPLEYYFLSFSSFLPCCFLSSLCSVTIIIIFFFSSSQS